MPGSFILVVIALFPICQGYLPIFSHPGYNLRKPQFLVEPIVVNIPRLTTRLFIEPAASQPGFDRTKRQPSTPPPPINEFIKVSPVRLIVPGNNTGEEIMVGIFPLAEAQKMAESLEMDLVLINDKADPPVCKVIDYGKFKYSLEKKKKENLKKQVKQDIKEVKMSYKIDQHDFEVRLRACQKFLDDGDRVKVIVQFKGREIQYKDLGRDLLLKLFKPVEDIALVEAPPKVEGKSMTMLLGPKKTK